MGFFDTLKVMKDIVVGGIESFKAGEKLDELIEKSLSDYEDVLTTEEKNFYQAYQNVKSQYESNTDSNENQNLIEKIEDAQIAYLESLENNSSLPKSFREEIKTSIEELKKADNMALDSLGETLEKYAENDEQKAEVRKTLEESKRK